MRRKDEATDPPSPTSGRRNTNSWRCHHLREHTNTARLTLSDSFASGPTSSSSSASPCLSTFLRFRPRISQEGDALLALCTIGLPHLQTLLCCIPVEETICIFYATTMKYVPQDQLLFSSYMTRELIDAKAKSVDGRSKHCAAGVLTLHTKFFTK